MKFNWKYILIVVIVACFVIGGILIYQWWESREEKVARSNCLAEDEVAGYKIDKKGTARGIAKIFIKDQESIVEKFSFQIDNTSNVSHAIEMYKCNIYVIRIFNYDDKRGTPLPNYRTELWRFRYDESGEKLLDLFENEKAPDNYGQSFRIDSSEIYVVLERDYLGHPNFALVIKDLKTKEDVFVFPINEIVVKYPSIVGSLRLRNWTKNNHYFWADIFMGANVLGFFRIDTTNWNLELFETPEGVGGGDALNIEKGYVTRHPGHVWTGVHELTEQIKQEWREQGKVSSLYLYNLFTKEETLIATTEEPLWFFKPKWISDTELEYELPNGEKKVYVIEE